jgi:hypothetical protein
MCKNKILSMVFCIIIFAANAYGREGYILPDYHRLLRNGQAINMNLGIYEDGNLFLKFNASEYPLYDLDAFKRGTDQAMEYTQALQHGGENSRNFFKSKSVESTLLLYNSSSTQDNEKINYFTMVFNHHGTAGQYPIKITFYDGTPEPLSLNFPPGELQYLQKVIDIVLENKEEYIAKGKHKAQAETR